jgi:hypothetical protein
MLGGPLKTVLAIVASRPMRSELQGKPNLSGMALNAKRRRPVDEHIDNRKIEPLGSLFHATHLDSRLANP